MGASCQQVNRHHDTLKLKDQYREFRKKFFQIWSENPIYKFLQEDIDKIDKGHQELMQKGPEFFVLENFINSLAKVDDFNKKILNHLNKLFINKLNEVLQGLFPDVNQFFLNVVIFLLSNPNMSHKKVNLGESFLNCYLIRQRKKKSKNKKKKEGETDENNTNIQSTEAKAEPENQGKKLNLTVMKDIFLFLGNFALQILIYFVLNFVYVLESSKKLDMYDFDSEIKDANGETIMYDYEYTFLKNFRLVNRAFNKDVFNTLWTNFLLQPFEKRIIIFKFFYSCKG